MDESMYPIGYKFGRHWAKRDATPEQRLRVSDFEVGERWVAAKIDPGREFTRVVDPEKSGFLGIGDSPSASFVAGFIDGAKSINPLRKYKSLALNLAD